MVVDYLIVGQGICGTMLSWFLRKEGKSFLVIDEARNDTSSKVAAGLINPVTGRRYSYSWMADILLPFAESSYTSMEAELGLKFFEKKNLIDFFPSPNARLAFIETMNEREEYLNSYPDQNHFNQFFDYEFGCGEIRPVYTAHLSLLLPTWRSKLHEWNSLREEPFEFEHLVLKDGSVSYHDVEAEKIIFCEGATGEFNPFFEKIPFAPNKGQAIIIEAADLPGEHVYKRGQLLVPMAKKDHYWVGASYQWKYEDAQPTQAFLEQVQTLLNNWIKPSYRIVAHLAAIRPATLERRPFVGLHPQHDAVGIFNGMGTKGTSLAPFFANQLVQNLVHGLPITPEADIRRFSRILSK